MVGPLQQRGNNQAVAIINSANDNIVKTADAIYELFVGIKAISPLSAEIDPTIPVAT